MSKSIVGNSIGRQLTVRKLSAAAAAVVLSLSSYSQAGSLPYSTSFESSPPDAQGQTYVANTPLVGQNGWTNEDGEPQSGAAVSTATASTGSNSVELLTTGFGGNNPSGSQFSDYYNSALADHTGSTATVPGTAINATGSTINISFTMDHLTGLTGDGAGLDIFAGNDTLVAGLFAVTNASTGSHDLEVYNDSTGPVTVTGPAGAGVADGGFATYRISLNFSTHTFTVFVDGNTASETFSFDPAQNTIGGVAFSMDDVETNGTTASAFFDDLSVVPEPASAAMMALGGGLMLMTRRPKRTEETA